jgi:lipoate-protein ligase A
MTRGLWLDSPPLDVYEQMALDEALCVPAQKPAFRAYNWKGGGYTFGYAQFFDEVKKNLPAGAAFTRRPTGGGIVEHTDDFTFCCVLPETERRPPQELYSRLHGAFLSALRAGGVECVLSSPQPKASAYAPSSGGIAAACFKNPVAQDLLDVSGNKILGGAIRRYDGVALYQGSLQIPGARGGTEEFAKSFANALGEAFGMEWERSGAGELLLDHVRAEAVAKYRSAQWCEKF